MSRKRLELSLIIVIFVEVLAALMLVIWAAFIKDGGTAAETNTKKTPSSNSQLTSPPSITPVLFSDGLKRPTTITGSTDPADSRLFVTEAQGTVMAVSGDGKIVAGPILDIKSRVQDQGEMGLLGLALHPDFKTNGYLYVNYVDKQQNTIIARYTQSKQTGKADTSTEKVLLKIKQPYPNHNGGMIAFGPDGYLYIGMGDGGSGGDPENRAQNRNELLGKMLRIDVDQGSPYAVPASNPFKGQSGVKPEIWALGLRNPWRFSFDRSNGDLYIADVGQNEIEEVHLQKASSKGGENYGWRCYEGTHAYNTEGCGPAKDYKTPIFEYDHSEKRCSITGGYVYRGEGYPAMQGKYFYADLCGKQIYYAEFLGGSWKQTLAASSELSISSFGENVNGELFAADIETGKIYRLTDSGNQ
jgi:glucose/arabinose dehydrogenase